MRWIGWSNPGKNPPRNLRNGESMLLDTSFCIDYFRELSNGKPGPAYRKLESFLHTPLYLPLFVVCELQAGARMARSIRHELAKVDRLTERFEVLYPNPSFPVMYGQAEACLRSEGQPIPTMDLLIAVLAQSYGMPLLTRDVKHYSRIVDLVVEGY